MDWLTCIENFIEVVNNKGFSQASRKLFISNSTLSKQVQWLEEETNARLLNRNTRSLSLTEAGSKLYEYGKHLLAGAENIKTELLEDKTQPKGLLTVAVPSAFGSHYITPILPEFLNRYPEIQLECIYDASNVQLLEENIDLALRVNAEPNSHFQVQILKNVQIGYFAAPCYLKKYGVPLKLEDLAQHYAVMMHFDKRSNSWEFNKPNFTPPKARLVTNNHAAVEAAAIAGTGLIAYPSYTFENQIKEKKLIPVLEKYWPNPYQINLMYPRRDYVPTRIQVFINFLQEKLGEKHG